MSLATALFAGYEQEMDIIIVKWVHIISSTILFGTGIGSAFYMFMANRREAAYKGGDINQKQANLAAICFATRHVVIADWIFTTPAIITQFITGVTLVYLLDYDFNQGWIIAALALYFFSGLCWLPVVWIQIKMRDMASIALETNTNLSDVYWRYDRWWIGLGALAFPAVVLIFWLMVAKPDF